MQDANDRFERAGRRVGGGVVGLALGLVLGFLVALALGPAHLGALLAGGATALLLAALGAWRPAPFLAIAGVLLSIASDAGR